MKRSRRKETKNFDPEFVRPEPTSKKLWVPGDPIVNKTKVTTVPKRIVGNLDSGIQAKLENIKRVEIECSTTQKLLFNERQKLFDLYSEVILSDYSLCLKYELDSRQWKYCVYSIFSASRKNFVLMNQTEKDIWNAYFITLNQKYTRLIQALAKIGLKYPVWSRCYSHLGDLARYRFQFLVPQSPNLLSEAKAYYNTARTLAPKNGLYFNQLGLVSRLEGNVADTIQYHLRALCLERPLETARETLLEVFQLLSTSEAEIQTYSNKSFLRNAELTFLQLIKILYTKIGVDEWSSLMDLFATNFALGLDDFSEMQMVKQFQFCFSLAIIPISVFQTIQLSRTFESDAKIMLQQRCFELVMTIVSKFAHLVQIDSIKMFMGIVFSWVGSNEVPLALATDRSFRKTWGQVVEMFNKIAPNGFREQSEQLELADVYKRTEYLTEDLQVYGFVPLSKFVEFGEWKNSEVTKMEWGYEVEAMSLKRTARVILLVICLSQKYSFIDFTDTGREKIANIFKLDELAQDDMNLDSGEDEDELRQEDVKKKISVDNLVSDIEVSPGSMVLKEKLQALAQEATVSQPKNLIPGQTVLIFDTNIFLRGISGISNIIDSKKYPVVVPLPVITELTGISGNDNMVGSHASEALEYLKIAISEKRFKIQTAKGSFLDSMVNISESWDPKHTNADDVILDICRMHKNVCLITDDANLRLKCRTVGVLCLDSIYKIRL